MTDAKGTSTSGIHLNEDEYSVHLRDIAGNLRSFMKSELKEITLPRQSLMPAYPALASTDLENLVAYLSSLRPMRTSPARQQADAAVWTFDRLDNIGGHRTTVLGEPRIIDSPVGKAVEFDGVDDALFIDNHPLAGAATFTWEGDLPARRRRGGAAVVPFERAGSRHRAPTRTTGCSSRSGSSATRGTWTATTNRELASKALMNRDARHPLGAWYHVASVYDGKEFSNYVDGVREGAAEVQLAPHGPGHASVGVRINKVFYFKGAVRLARFTRRALSPAEFLEPPAKR